MELQRLLRISTLVRFIIKVMQKRHKPPLMLTCSHLSFSKAAENVRAAALPGIGLEEENRSEPQAREFLCKNVSTWIWVKIVYSVEISKTKASV